MYFKQFYLGCLAHASYLIGSKGDAVVVDPQRDVEQYLVEAAAHGFKIAYIIETHLHADFVSGHRELAERTGATIVLSERAGAAFPHKAVKDGDELRIGDIRLGVLETPGHSPESICILLDDTAHIDEPMKLLTGDTLFIGDVGRPDLAAAKGYTAEEMAGLLYESLHNKVLQLGDSVEVYPAHGAGSLCGRNIAKELWSTIGQQKHFNYALQPMTKQEFVTMMTTNMPEAPAYFFTDAEINRTGARRLAEASGPPALSASEVKQIAEAGGVILDVRSAASFGDSHIPGALNIGLSGQFAMWAGSLLSLTAPLVIVADDSDTVEEAVMRLARVGIETVKGYLDGGMQGWKSARFKAETIPLITVEELGRLVDEESSLQVFDVRRPSEAKNGQIAGAHNIELAHLADVSTAFDRSRPTAVICQSGYRSAIAASILARGGFAKVFNVAGGMNTWDNFRRDRCRAMAGSGCNGLTV